MAYQIVAAIQPRPTGQPDYGGGTFPIEQTKLAWSWGVRPAEAEVVYVAESPIAVGAEMSLVLGSAVFWGICKEQISTVSSTGHSKVCRFADMREYLWWDVIFGSFNNPETRLIAGVRVKRWWHITPANHASGIRTYTNDPLTASEILDLAFAAPTTGTSWTRSYHSDMGSYPVYQVDCMSGVKLGQLISDVSDRLGLTVTLKGGKYRLEWTRKGVGTIPSFPSNSDNRRTGYAITGNPTRVFVVGERNLYQVLNVTLEADWQSAWNAFYDVSLLAEFVYEHGVDPISGNPYKQSEGADPEQIVGRQLAAARALSITVREVAAMKEAVSSGTGAAFLDPRRYSGKSRNDIPAAIYIRSLLFRAFRVPASFTLLNFSGVTVTREGLTIIPQSLVRVTHDAVSGVISGSTTDIPMGDGYAIAKGYKVGSDLFRGFDVSRFNLTEWVGKQDLWTHVGYQLDDSGDNDQFLLFDEPVLRSSDLVSLVDGHAVLKAYPAFTVPTVKAALTFAAERFRYVQGYGSLDESLSVSGLNGEFVMANGSAASTELTYADGRTAAQNAIEIATAFLARPLLYVSGGYVVAGNNATQLTSMIDRVLLVYSAKELTETVDFVNERGRGAFEPEREFERRRQLERTVPGQAELRTQSDMSRQLGMALKHNRTFAKTLIKAFQGTFLPPGPVKDMVVASPSTTALAFGTPLWKEPTAPSGSGSAKTVAVLPSAVGSAHKVFAGAVVQDGKLAKEQVPVQSTGVVLLRVMGPVDIGDSVGRELGQDYLKKDGDPTVGRVLQVISGATVKLVLVNLSAPAGSTMEINICDLDRVPYKVRVYTAGEPEPL